MELISFGKELLQSAAEHMASYRAGQTALRHADRTLSVLEKSARWAVPPPNNDERPQPELVRPLPWVFFLLLLVVLRLARELISLVNLVMGKPPLRSADVVTYVQGKRRYLRTLKYQGTRLMRARGAARVCQGLRSLLHFTMCFRGSSNNNIAAANANDQVLVVKRSKKGRANSSPVASGTESTMERLIEKMMVDLNADSDDDSSYTLTNATSTKTDSEADSEQDTVFSGDITLSTPSNKPAISTPEKENDQSEQNFTPNESEMNINSNTVDTDTQANGGDSPKQKSDVATSPVQNTNGETQPSTQESDVAESHTTVTNNNVVPKEKLSPKAESEKLIQNEKCNKQAPTKKTQKIANGRVIEKSPGKKKENSRH